ncbi:MAG: SsrA-binding protein SmpB [Patescibacteria group bacterium]
MKIYNNRAKHDYFLYSTVEAGLVLLGTEARALHDGRGDISNAFARIRDGEIYLVGANIPPHTGSGVPGYNPLRTRKLLLNRHEIVSLGTKMKQQNLLLVPILVYNKGPRVKIELALAKGKKKFEKKEAKKKKDIDKLVEIEARGKW